MSIPKAPFPYRGPRVMHGMGALVGAAHTVDRQLLSGVAGPDADKAAEATEARIALQELLSRLATAENKVRRIEMLLSAWNDQCAKQPADDLSRHIAETMLTGIRDTLKAEDKAAEDRRNGT